MDQCGKSNYTQVAGDDHTAQACCISVLQACSGILPKVFSAPCAQSATVPAGRKLCSSSCQADSAQEGHVIMDCCLRIRSSC